MSGRCASCAMHSAYRPRAITPGDHGQRARARSPIANGRAISGGFMPSTGADMGAAYPRRTACRGPERRPQAGRAGDAPAWHPGSRAASLSCVHHRQQAFSADRGHPARPEFRGREAGSEPAPAKAGVWLADITDILTGEGWLYLAVSPDRFTRKIVGWAMREHMRAELTMAALTMAVQRRRPRAGLIHHADRASHYAAGDYRNIPQAAAITPSMSRKPNCRDNAPIESVFGTLKTELVHQREYPHRDAAAQPVRVHPSLLQSSADPLRYRLHHPRAGRPENRITPCPLSRGKVTRAYPSLPLGEPAHRRRRWQYKGVGPLDTKLP